MLYEICRSCKVLEAEVELSACRTLLGGLTVSLETLLHEDVAMGYLGQACDLSLQHFPTSTVP